MTFEKTTTMEQKIIQAARETFLKKGYKETNMSDIAAAVGLTRPAMHYYFRTKERLFQTVFGDILESFLPKIKGLINSDLSLEDKIGHIVDEYLVIFKETPELPLFLIRRLQETLTVSYKWHWEAMSWKWGEMYLQPWKMKSLQDASRMSHS